MIAAQWRRTPQRRATRGAARSRGGANSPTGRCILQGHCRGTRRTQVVRTRRYSVAHDGRPGRARREPRRVDVGAKPTSPRGRAATSRAYTWQHAKVEDIPHVQDRVHAVFDLRALFRLSACGHAGTNRCGPSNDIRAQRRACTCVRARCRLVALCRVPSYAACALLRRVATTGSPALTPR